ncbi:methyltransferase domain-containing protein [Sphingosinicella sp.]|uniref:class I SAM-dependent methyltransferase n=1 Tax=Sphingosinicella sp. TaxID=1917971 RepID=UPI0025ED77D0|nr:methyltransferase domain-containing protein [Sphingosinicella sp.]
MADLIDLQMSPLGLVAMDALAPAAGQTILDVGCGAGETILQFAERVGPSGRVVGVDIAPRVLAVARTRTAHLSQVTLLQEDAASLALPDQSFDGVFSRFGTMFFADPTQAITNIHRMLRRGGRIGFICWRSMRENELDFFPVEAAGLPIIVDATPFSFEDADTISRVLRSADFERIRIEAYNADISSGDADTMLKVITRVGALGKVLRETPALLPKAEPQVRTALRARERDGKVSLGAATWIVTATAA